MLHQWCRSSPEYNKEVYPSSLMPSDVPLTSLPHHCCCLYHHQEEGEEGKREEGCQCPSTLASHPNMHCSLLNIAASFSSSWVAWVGVVMVEEEEG